MSIIIWAIIVILIWIISRSLAKRQGENTSVVDNKFRKVGNGYLVILGLTLAALLITALLVHFS